MRQRRCTWQEPDAWPARDAGAREQRRAFNVLLALATGLGIAVGLVAGYWMHP
jgi:hypothetical protein